MKNDPNYEAWVLGYTAQDRAVRNPWASLPGYAPNYHTEKFGATINEHLGQTTPMSSPSTKDSVEDGVSWWIKRHNAMKKASKEQEAKFYREAVAKRQEQQRRMIGINFPMNTAVYHLIRESTLESAWSRM